MKHIYIFVLLIITGYIHTADNQEVTDWAGRNALHIAALDHGNRDTIITLVSQGLPVDSTDDFGETPLHLAALSGNLETVQALLDLGADPKQANFAQEIPEETAIGAGHPHIAELLKRHGDEKIPDIKNASSLND